MAYEIGSAPVTFELSTYFGSGVNNTLAYNIEGDTPHDKAVVLALIRYDVSLTAGDVTAGKWMAAVRRIQEYSTALQCVIIMYGHDDSSYSKISGAKIQQSLATYYYADESRYLTNSDFDDIPILIDEQTSSGNTDFISKQYRDTGILADPDNLNFDIPAAASVPNECCFYILQPWTAVTGKFHRITDKWHTEAFTKTTYPISLRHLQDRVPSSTVNQTGNPEIIDSYISERAANLTAAAKIIRTYPADTETVNSLSSIDVVFSRPMDMDPIADFDLAGNGINGTAVFDSATYSGQNKIENITTVQFKDYSLIDNSGSDENATITVSGSISPDFTSTWTIDKICKPVLSLDDPGDEITNSGPVLIKVDFGETVSDIAASVNNNWCSTNNAVVAMDTTSPTDDSGYFILEITPTDSDFTGHQEGDEITIVIPAGITTDSIGNANTVSDSLTFIYDIEAPSATLSMESTDIETVSGPFTINLDFDETVKWTTVISSILNNTSTNCTLSNLKSVPENAPGDYHKSYTATVIPSGNPVKIVIKPDVAEDTAGNGNIGTATGFGFDVSYDPNPGGTGERHIAVVVDVSGSMGSKVSVNTAPAQPKIEFIKEALAAFLNELSQAVSLGNLNAADLVRFYKYADNAAALTIDGLQWLRLDQLSTDRIEELMTLLDTGGGTAMGDGLVLPLGVMNYLQDQTQYGHNRHIILFADGQRNRGVGISLDSETGTVTINSSPAIVMDPAATWNIPIHTVGVMTSGQGTESDWLTRMESISGATGGNHHAMTDQTVWSQTNQALTGIVETIYNGNTPQEVFSVTDSISIGTQSRSFNFTLDRSHHSMLILVSWPADEAVEINLKKGNATVQSSIADRTGSRHFVSGYHFPIIKPIVHRPFPVFRHSLFPFTFIQAEGDWEITVSRKKQDADKEAPFYISVLGNGKGFDYSLEIPRKRYIAGTPIGAVLRLKINGSSSSVMLGGDLKVERQKYPTADVLADFSDKLPKPGLIKDIILSDGIIQISTEASEKNPVGSQLKLLKMNRYAWPLLCTKQQMNIPGIRSIFPGSLKWTINDTSTPGIYNLRFNIRGVDPKYGKYMRTISKTITVHPRIDALADRIKVEKLNPDRLKVFFTPKSASGYHLGPGWGPTLRVHCKSLKQGEVSDYLDGSYSVVLTFSGNNPGNTTIRIEMAGQLLMRRSLKELLT